MDIKGILSISGQPGLYKLVTQTRNGIVVESLETQKRMQVFASAKISALEDIALYTNGEDKPLIEVLQNIYRKTQGQETISHKSKPEVIKKEFAAILPEYDQERVYVSDMKRVFNWFNILHKHGLVDLEEKTEETEPETTEPNNPTTPTEQQ